MRCASCQGCSKAARPARRLASSLKTPTRARATTIGSRTASGPDTPTTLTSRNMGCAITAAAGAPRHAKPSCAARQVGSLLLEPKDPGFAYQNPFFCPDPQRVAELEALIWKVREAGDSIGARVTVVASGVPPGLGEPVFDRLDADIAHALMSINAVKAVEIGAGTQAAAQRGSEHRDELTPTGFRSNHAGGMLGGISSGQDVIAHLTFKPTSSIQVPGHTIDTAGRAVEIVTTGRHDPCVGLRATPIAEAMLAIVLMDHYLRQRAQNADVKSPTPVITDAPHG